MDAMSELPVLRPSASARPDAAAMAALAALPEGVVAPAARTHALASLAAAALRRSSSPGRCLGRALARFLVDARAARQPEGAPAPARPTRDELAHLAGPVANALRRTRRLPPPPPQAARAVEVWCEERAAGDPEVTLAEIVTACLHASAWTEAEAGIVLAAALTRVGGPRTGVSLLDEAVTRALEG